MSERPAAPVRPILKWAGGKRQLLPELRPFFPRVFARYVEPFLGSGAVFLDLYNAGLLDGRQAVLTDINADIIGITVRAIAQLGSSLDPATTEGALLARHEPRDHPSVRSR